MPGGEEAPGSHYSGLLPDGWERSETATGIPYYRNNTIGSTQWEHPEITQVFKDVDEMNGIKYAAYRTAMKLRALQKYVDWHGYKNRLMEHAGNAANKRHVGTILLICLLNLVSRHVMEQAFSELGLDQAQNSGVLAVAEVGSILNKMFQLSGRDEFIQPERSTELALNWALRCFDSGRTGYVKIRSLKVGLMAMSAATLEEKYHFMFRQVINGHVGISHSSLRTLIQDLLLLPQHVSEGGTFGPDTVTDAVQNCWRTVNNQPTDLLNEDEFLGWVLKEPVWVVWLPTLHRLATAETVKHEAKCSVCKVFPLVGFRYRCLKCTNTDLCQNCFWTQQTARNHKVSHPMKEYCLATTSGDDVKDFMKQMKNKVTRKYRRKPPKKSYLDYPTTKGSGAGDNLPTQSPVLANVHTRVNRLASRLHELEGPPEGVQLKPATITTHIEHHERPVEPQPSGRRQMVSGGQTEELREHNMRAELEERNKQLAAEVERNKQLAVEVERNKQLAAKVERNKQLAAEVERNKQLAAEVERNKQLAAEVESLREQLKQKQKEVPPQVIRVPVPMATSEPTTPRTPGQPGVTSPPALPEETPHRTQQEWSYLFGGEEQEMQAMVEELLTAFPTLTTESVATDLGNELFMAAAAVGHTMSSMVEQVASTQDFQG